MRGSPEQLTKTVTRAEMALSLEMMFGGVLAGLCERRGLASFAKRMRERMCMGGVHVLGEGVRRVPVGSG